MSESTEVAVAKQQTELVVVEDNELERMAQVSRAVDRTHNMIANASGDMERVVLQAKLMRFLHENVTDDVIECLVDLQNNPNGFMTDRTDGYSDDVIKEVAVSAWLQGATMVFNEVNILAGRCYLTKKFYDRKMKQLGLSEYQQQIGHPEIIVTGKTKKGQDKGTALFPAIATWFQNGERKQVHCAKTADGDFRIACNYSASDSPDATRGRAESKLWKMVFKQAAGYELLEREELEKTVDSPRHTIVDKQADAEPKLEREHETPKQLTDRAEAWTHRKLQACESLHQVREVEASALKLIAENAGGCSEDEVLEIQDYISRLCEHRRDEIRATRGERSGK